jgi:hypothetical protein
MRHRLAGAAGVAAILLAAGPASAYFEQTLVGARGGALGAGASAFVHDVSAYYWNPAALSAVRRPEALADHARPYGVPDLSATAVAVALPAYGSGWAVAWHRYGIADVYAEDQFALAAGRVVWERERHRLAAGATFKYGRLGFAEFADPLGSGTIDIGSQAKGSLDAGLLWTTPWALDFAWVGRDLLRPRYALVEGSGGDRLETRHELAAALRWNRESTITFGWAEPEVGAASFNAGLEILFFDVFAIRSGVTNLSNVYQSLSPPTDMQFTGGFGVFHKGYYVDAAATTNRDLGASYQVTLRVPFGSTSR